MNMNRSGVFNLYIRQFKKKCSCSLLSVCYTSLEQEYVSVSRVIHKTLIVGETTNSGPQKDYVTELLLHTRLLFFLGIVMCERNKPSFLNHCIWGLFVIIAQLILNKNTLSLAPSFCGNNIYHKPFQAEFPFYSYFLTYSSHYVVPVSESTRTCTTLHCIYPI